VPVLKNVTEIHASAVLMRIRTRVRMTKE